MTKMILSNRVSFHSPADDLPDITSTSTAAAASDEKNLEKAQDLTNISIKPKIIQRRVNTPSDKFKLNTTFFLDGDLSSPYAQTPFLLVFNKPINVVTSIGNDTLRCPSGVRDTVSKYLPPVIDGNVIGSEISSNYNNTGKKKGGKKGKKEGGSSDTFHPVGRLDFETHGLLLFSSNGGLTNKLLSPTGGITKTYIATVENEVNEEELIERMKTGVDISAGNVKAEILSVVENEGDSKLSDITLEVKEGKHRMVRKMLFNVGHPVVGLKRIKVGEIVLDDEKTKSGTFRVLTGAEERWMMGLDFDKS